MRIALVTILIFTFSLNCISQDSTKTETKSNGFVFVQLGTMLSIYSIGYGYEFYSKNEYSLQVSTGFGLDLIRFSPYNFENLIKTRHSYRFNDKNAMFMDLGVQFVYNPWYIDNPDKFFPNCELQRCPYTMVNYFVGLGYQMILKSRYSLSFSATANYYDRGFLPFPLLGMQFRYLFIKDSEK